MKKKGIFGKLDRAVAFLPRVWGVGLYEQTNAKKKNKADRHKSRTLSLQRATDRPTTPTTRSPCLTYLNGLTLLILIRFG